MELAPLSPRHERVVNELLKEVVYRGRAVVSKWRVTEMYRQELDEIDAALGRIEGGRYGMCEVCGGAIGRGRLRAMPEARRCLRCE